LEEIEFEGGFVSDNIVGQGRWTVLHRIIFRHEEKFYEWMKSVGATEMQENDFDPNKKVECKEVFPHKVECVAYKHAE
jgi:hypothetical protein